MGGQLPAKQHASHSIPEVYLAHRNSCVNLVLVLATVRNNVFSAMNRRDNGTWAEVFLYPGKSISNSATLLWVVTLWHCTFITWKDLFKATAQAYATWKVNFSYRATSHQESSYVAVFGLDKSAVHLFALVHYLFTMQFLKESQDLATNQHVCKDCSKIG